MSKTLDILVNIKYTENVKSILHFESEGVLGMAENGFWWIGIFCDTVCREYDQGNGRGDESIYHACYCGDHVLYFSYVF